MQYCGDETAALVGDLGSRTFKFGFAGEDAPKGVVPSAVGRGTQAPPEVDSAGEGEQGESGEEARKKRQRSAVLVGHTQLRCRSNDLDVDWARQDGCVRDWDAVEALWTHALEHALSSNPREHPLLAACPSYESSGDKARMAELAFERLEVPAFFLARNAMLSAFSLGRASALVVDIGAARTCAAVVQDGYVLNKSLRTTPVASDLVDRHLVHLLEDASLPSLCNSAKDGTKPAPRGPLRTPAMLRRTMPSQGGRRVVLPVPDSELSRVSASYVEWEKLELAKDIKSTVCRVWADLSFDEAKAAVYAKERYELPDGTEIFLGPDRFKSGELLMNPAMDMAFITEKLPQIAADPAAASLPQIVRDALQSVHVDLRRELAQQIVLVGGGSLLPGTVERLMKELVQILPSALKPRFLTPSTQERLYANFTGASILATLGSFQQLWVSKQEYDEHGAAVLNSRCAQ